MYIEDIRRISISSGNLSGEKTDLSVYVCMTLQIIEYNQHVFSLHHIILCNGSCHIGCQEQCRRKVIIQCCQNNGIIHSSTFLKLLIDSFYIFLDLSDGNIDADHIFALLVCNGIQSDLGLTGLFVTDNQLTLAFTDRVDQIDPGDPGLERTADFSAVHDGDRLILDRDRLCVLEDLISHSVASEHINDS